MIKGLKVLVASAVLIGFCSWANAAATLTISDGIDPLVSVTDNGLWDLNTAIGGIIVNTHVGAWNLVLSTGSTKPVAGSATAPVMDLGFQLFSSAGGNLTITFSDTSFGPAAGTINSIVDGHVITGAGANVSLDIYGDSGNVVSAQTTDLASTGWAPLTSTTTASGPLSLTAPFSLTEVVQFSSLGSTYISADASFSVVPEPGLLALSALGLAVCALARAHRRNS